MPQLMPLNWIFCWMFVLMLLIMLVYIYGMWLEMGLVYQNEFKKLDKKWWW